MDLAERARVGAGSLDELADEELLKRFASRQEEAAFAALVRRHGPLVLGVCRRVLQHAQDAEDAFQAAFCVLARKARAIRRRDAVGAWLYAVAFRIARKARASRGRRPVLQSELPEIAAPSDSPEWVWREIRPVLDQEVSRLPDKYRQPFVLCYLEGKTNEQAAAELGCPLGTVLSRLARARGRLRDRLTRRGLALSAGMVTAVLGEHAGAASVPGVLTEAATQAALSYATGQPTATGVAGLADEFLQTLAWTRKAAVVKLMSALGVVMVAIVLLLWFLGRPVPGNAPARPSVSPQAERERLQGSWRAASFEKAGQAQDIDVHLGFAGDQWTMVVAGQALPPRPYVLDPSQEPKTIDFTMGEGIVVRGIYQLDGDSFTMCINQNSSGGKRPTAFRTLADDPMVTLWVLRREAIPGAGMAPDHGRQ
jgi:RNA polymerase sigma factor (sigma-70 family)